MGNERAAFIKERAERELSSEGLPNMRRGRRVDGAAAFRRDTDFRDKKGGDVKIRGDS